MQHPNDIKVNFTLILGIIPLCGRLNKYFLKIIMRQSWHETGMGTALRRIAAQFLPDCAQITVIYTVSWYRYCY
jgi:hypothetical protein